MRDDSLALCTIVRFKPIPESKVPLVHTHLIDCVPNFVTALMDPARINREIFKAFKARGLSLRADASKALQRVLIHEDDAQAALSSVLEAIKERIEKKDIQSTVIDLASIEAIVVALSSTDEDLSSEATQLFDAYESPRVEFDERQRAYRVIPNPTFQLHGPAESKAKMFRERLIFIQQRLLRSSNGRFKLRSLGASKTDDEIELSSIDSLLGNVEERVLLGYLVMPSEDSYYLEDLTGLIPLDLSTMEVDRQVFMRRLFTLGTIVIVEGKLSEGVFHVKAFAMPPAEKRMITLNAMNVVDTFGTGTRQDQSEHMRNLEESAHDTLFVVMSDVAMDKAYVMEKLQTVLEGYEACGVDPLFILIGSFTSRPYLQKGAREEIKSIFKNLATIICSCPRLSQNAKFLLVPGPEDPGMGSVLPRRKIPDIFVQELQDKVPHLTFASNPCRIRFYTQEIVILRENLLEKMQRMSIIDQFQMHEYEEEGVEVSQTLSQTILDQAHLAPLPLPNRPIYWELDHAMRLTPLPHLLILADKARQYHHEYCDCSVVNPGPFSSDFSFIAYRPSTRSVEFSRV